MGVDRASATQTTWSIPAAPRWPLDNAKLLEELGSPTIHEALGAELVRTFSAVRARDGIFINVAMVAAGYAVPLPIPPNVAHAKAIHDAASAARYAGAGLWGQAGFACAPLAHRSGRC